MESQALSRRSDQDAGTEAPTTNPIPRVSQARKQRERIVGSHTMGRVGVREPQPSPCRSGPGPNPVRHTIALSAVRIVVVGSSRARRA